MPHKLLKLFELNRNLKGLAEKELIEWIKHLFSSQVDGNLTIICGIFRELYYQGDQNDDKLIDSLLNKSIELDNHNNNFSTEDKTITAETEQSDIINIDNSSNVSDTINYISRIPDSILSNISTFLTQNQLFATFNLVCYKFLNIGLKSHSIKNIDLFMEYDYVPFKPKFNLNYILSKLKSLDVGSMEYGLFHYLFDIKTFTFPKSIKLGMFYVFIVSDLCVFNLIYYLK